MKQVILCVFILLVSANVFANDVDIKQLTKAAKKGDAEAQYQLGYSYYYGEGVRQNRKEAVYWYTKAAKLNHAEAQYLLAYSYHFGNSITQDYKQSIYWYTKAAEQGHANAQFDLGRYYDVGLGVPQDYKQAYMWYSLCFNQLPDTKKNTTRKLLNELEQKMTAAEITEARQMAAEWLAKHQ